MKPIRKPMNLILCGLPGVGKTEIGKLIATQLSKPFFDTDTLLESRYSCIHKTDLSCRQIHQKIGEQQFRHLEHEVVASLVIYKDSVIATGGGIITNSTNIPLLKSIGTIITLTAPSDVLLKRILAHGTPTYISHKNPKESFEDLVATRSPIYEKISDFLIDTTARTPLEIAEMISKISQSHGQ